MNEINIRFKQLRELCDKTQAEFGKALGLSVSGVSDIERGKRNVTEQHLIMLSNWKEKCINIDWLRTGNGEPILKPMQNDLIAKSAQILGERDPVFEAFVETYSKLTPGNREALLEFLMDFLKTVEKKKE